MPDPTPAQEPSRTPQNDRKLEANSQPQAQTETGTASKPVVGKIEYPEAKRSNKPGYHYSPYAPYELLDTRGIEPGGLARDPGNGDIFRLPK